MNESTGGSIARLNIALAVYAVYDNPVHVHVEETSRFENRNAEAEA